VALTVRSISSLEMPSMVVGIWVGSEVGRVPEMVTVPSWCNGAWADSSAWVMLEKAASSANASGDKVGFMGVPEVLGNICGRHAAAGVFNGQERAGGPRGLAALQVWSGCGAL
jgi:hypothetical protein